MRGLIVLGVLLGAVAGHAAEPLVPDHLKKGLVGITAEFTPAEAKRGQTVVLTITVEPKPGWHTYPTKQDDPNAQSQVNKIVFAPPTVLVPVGPLAEEGEADSEAEPGLDIKKLSFYRGKTKFKQTFVVAPTATPGEMQYQLQRFIPQLCTDKLPGKNSYCLPAAPVKLSVGLKVADAPPVEVAAEHKAAVEKAQALPTEAPKPADPPKIEPAKTEPAASGPRDPAKDLADVASRITNQQAVAPHYGDITTFLLAAAFWGFTSLITPCVFPMVPITVSIFLKQSATRTEALKSAAIYSITIVIVLGISAVTLLEVFRALSVNPYMNLFLGGLFIFFALSLFGMYEITLPSFLTRFTSQRESTGVIGTIFMALTFTIISFTCVAPFLGGFSGLAASGGFNRAQLFLGGFVFATAFATPFFLLALFPSLLKSLPKSGGWLNTVKVVMGFLELAAALKFFRTAELRLLPTTTYFTYDVVLATWVGISVLTAFYLLNVYRLSHDDEVQHVGAVRVVFATAFMFLAVYLTPALFTKGTASERQRPNGVIYAWVDSFLLPEPGEGDLPWSIDLKATVELARQELSKSNQRQYVFIDFTGVTCTNCRLNERNVFSRPEVKNLLNQYKLVALYTDDVPEKLYSSTVTSSFRETEAAVNLGFQRKLLNDERLPLYAILEPLPDGKISFVGVYEESLINNVAAFTKFLQQPLNQR